MYNVGDSVLGKYQIREILKPGSFGTVFRVHNFGLDRKAVIKIVRASDPKSLKELIESYSANLCDHDNVVKIYACEVLDVLNPSGAVDRHIIMELEDIQGGTVQDAISSAYVCARQSANWMKNVLFAAQYAHSKGIIHGDIKPDNIFIDFKGAKLADFGLSKNSNYVGINRAQDAFYITHGAPELHAGSDIDIHSDIYAAGVTFFRMISNISDWKAIVLGISNYTDILRKGQLIKRIGYPAFIPKALQKIINKACSPIPSNRYQSCAAFREALEKLRFSRDWQKINDNEWVSNIPGRIESIELVTRTKTFDVEYKVNGRRTSKDCARFSNKSDAYHFMHKKIAETTIE